MQTEKWAGLDSAIECGTLNIRMPNYQRKKKKAIELCLNAMTESSREIMISVSGGKDSIAMLNIVDTAAKMAKKDYFIWAHVSTASFPGTVEVIREAAAKVHREVVIDESSVDAFDVIGKGSVQRFGKLGYFSEAISSIYKERNVDLSFVGVRAGESKRRKKSIDAHGADFESSAYQKRVRIVYPLAYMSVIDVFSLLVESGLPIHPIYTKMAIDQRPIRLGYATSVDLLDKGTAVFLRLNYPELYNRVAKAYPEVRNYG